MNSSTELAEVLGPTGLFGPAFGRDALRRVLAMSQAKVKLGPTGFFGPTGLFGLISFFFEP